MNEPKTNNLIHVAKIFRKGRWKYLLLRKISSNEYQWFEDFFPQPETPTSIISETSEEAIRLAKRDWKNDSFTTIKCGFRFTLPERDEIGGNALFHQMAASYASVNGIYVDNELGHSCIVNNASQEAIQMLQFFKSNNRL